MNIGYLMKRKDACYYYRILSPISQLVQRGHETREEMAEQTKKCCGIIQERRFFEDGAWNCAKCGNDLNDGMAEWRKSVLDMIDWADVVVFARTTHDDSLKLMELVKKQGKPVVLEADDNYIEIPTWNTGYRYYHPLRTQIEAQFRYADLITVTTEQLALRYSEYNDTIRVCPNSMDVELIDVTPVAPDFVVLNGKGKRITKDVFDKAREKYKVIGWGGSPTHEKDLELVVPALKKMVQREDVVIAMVGYVHRRLVMEIPEDRLFLFGLVPVMQYYSLYKALKFDVGIAPVVDIAFNHGKSPIKTLEYQTIGVMPVASNTVTYRDTIHQGFLADNNDYEWFRQMRWALHADDRESRIAANRTYVEENFDMKNTIVKWEEAYSCAIEKVKPKMVPQARVENVQAVTP